MSNAYETLAWLILPEDLFPSKTKAFLYSGCSRDDGAFREITEKTFNMKPEYIGIFALRGFTGSNSLPVCFQFFRIVSNQCE